MTFNEQWASKRPREAELKDMPFPAAGVPGIKVKQAEDYIYMLLNFVTNTGSFQGSLRGQWVGDQYVVTSYGTPIGVKRGDLALLNTTEYSKTTERHKNIVKAAWGDIQELPAVEFPTF